MSGDFDGPPLAVGTVRGLRVFNVDSLGRLVGVTHRSVFRPGENVAVCQRRDYVAGGPDGVRAVVCDRAGAAGCGCGYWAFYDGSNDYAEDRAVTAVIEGYGQVTLGERGFRAEKARLLGLACPARIGELPQARRALTIYDAAGVPVYDTVWHLLRAHPVSDPHRAEPDPGPDNDPDFWDREEPKEWALTMPVSLWGTGSGTAWASSFRRYQLNRIVTSNNISPHVYGRPCSCVLCRPGVSS